jgi:hypothetical protein
MTIFFYNKNNYFRNLKVETEDCNLFGAFGFLVQFILAAAAFMVLILKRYLEKPRRPWKIWWFDVSKQIIGAGVIHLLNLGLSHFLTSEKDSADECVWYFVTLFLDCTLGTLFNWIIMLCCNYIITKFKWKMLVSGMYFEEYIKNSKKRYRLIPKMYFAQLGLWLIVTVLTKIFLLIFLAIFRSFFVLIGTYILKPFSSAKLRIVMVMIIFPIILNGLYFWVCDNLLKLKINQNDKDLKDFYERESNMGNNGNMNVKHPIDLPLDDDKVKKMNENIELKKNKDNNNIIEDNNINNINSNYAEENTNNNENNYHELNDL